MIIRTDQMINDPSSRDKLLFAFNFWQDRLRLSYIVGATVSQPKPLSANAQFTSADGLFGIPLGTYNSLSNIWLSIMKEKTLNILYRFDKINTWELMWEHVSYLNTDLAKLGTSEMFKS